MASLSASRFLAAIPFLFLFFKTLYAGFNVSFAHKASSFEPIFDFYGDAKLASDSVQLSGSVAHSAGRLVYKHPIKIVEGNPKKMVSFATSFGFSLSGGQGDGLAFMMGPIGYPVNVFDGGSFGLLGWSKSKFLAVEFDTFKDDKYGDLNPNHVGVNVAVLVPVKVANVSSVNLTMSGGKRLQSWIDYEANSKRLEVRLAELGETKPLDSLLSYPVDLSRIWGETEVLLILSSGSGNSLQQFNLYSWSLELSTIPHWLHSEPLDPTALMEKRKELRVQEKSDCAYRIIGALIFGFGCGALGALFVLFVWTFIAYRRPVVPEDYAVQVQPLEFDCVKAKVVDKASGKN